ncbi:MAG: hypothetical protein ACK559_03380, partial [bacterium]
MLAALQRRSPWKRPRPGARPAARRSPGARSARARSPWAHGEHQVHPVGPAGPDLHGHGVFGDAAVRALRQEHPAAGTRVHAVDPVGVGQGLDGRAVQVGGGPDPHPGRRGGAGAAGLVGDLPAHPHRGAVAGGGTRIGVFVAARGDQEEQGEGQAHGGASGGGERSSKAATWPTTRAATSTGSLAAAMPRSSRKKARCSSSTRRRSA